MNLRNINTIISIFNRDWSNIYMKKKKILLAAALLLSILLAAGGVFMSLKPCFTQFTPSEYTESAEALNNPYTGLYQIHTCTLYDDDSFDPSPVPEQEPGPGLILLQINLRNFNRTPVSEAGLGQLNRLLDTWHSMGKQLIVRFLYDWDGAPAETEPDSLSLILEHMSQTAEIINRHSDCIYILQGIFIGAWGEMHDSPYMNEEDMLTLINHLASVTDPDIFLAVRTPQQWRIIARSPSPLTAEQAFEGTLTARLSLFNDGMLGSETDLGTYGTSDQLSLTGTEKRPRQEELLFQNELCLYVPNGGEVVIPNPCNDLSSSIRDLSLTHVSYLNKDYDTSVFAKWQEEIYRGDSPFHGMNGYDYITRHLGYRYVIRSSAFSSGAPWEGRGTFAVGIENVGFANSYRAFEVSLVLKHTVTGKEYSFPVHTDTRFWNADSEITLEIPLELRRLPYGTYKSYLLIRDPASGSPIFFANEPAGKEPRCYLGSLTVEMFLQWDMLIQHLSIALP